MSTDKSKARRDPVEVWPPAAYIEDELVARGWEPEYLLEAVGRTLQGKRGQLAVLDVLEGKSMTRTAAAALGTVFGTSSLLWLNLDAVWWEWLALRRKRAKEQESHESG